MRTKIGFLFAYHYNSEVPNKHLLSECYNNEFKRYIHSNVRCALGSVLGSEDIMMNELGKIPFPKERF